MFEISPTTTLFSARACARFVPIAPLAVNGSAQSRSRRTQGLFFFGDRNEQSGDPRRLGILPASLPTLIERNARIPHSAKQVAGALFDTAERHVDREHGEQLYRTFVYDCKPLSKKAHNPITGRAIDFSRTPLYKFRNDLHSELVCMRKVALRLGELADDSHWTVRLEPLKRLLRREIGIEDLVEADLQYDVSQKGVDIKFGIDIASLAYKKLVQRVVLITGDSDFVPAAKLARREGLDVVLDPLWNHIAHSLHEHIDGLRSYWICRNQPGPYEICRRSRTRPRRNTYALP